MSPVEVTHGASPLILGFPHAGTFVPSTVLERFSSVGQLLADTDWHVDRLYDGLMPEASTVKATFHRYVIDANRDPEGTSLYPGQNTTDLVPLTDFDGRSIWQHDKQPDANETVERIERYHAPYHAAMRSEIERVLEDYGVAVLVDCHSIRSHIPFLFSGRLPDINLGTNNGTTCAPELEKQAVDVAAAADGYTWILNGRFKGGWTTRNYGRPMDRVHAIQIELAQRTYLAQEEPPFEYAAPGADRIRHHLRLLLEALATQASTLAK